MAFILLPPENRVLQESILYKLTNTKVEPCDSKLYDFDDVFYRLYVDFEDRSKMLLSLETSNWTDCKDNGSEAWIRDKVGEFVREVSDNGMDFEIPLGEQGAGDDDVKFNPEELAANLSRLRVYALGGPLYDYCRALSTNAPKTEPFSFQLRRDTYLWIVPKADRVVCILGLEFPIESDRIIANQILQEFVDVRRDRDVSNTPTIGFLKEAPGELNGLDSPQFDQEAFLGYFSILLLENHVREDRIETAVQNIIGFRSYLTYHIKCSKAFFHQRMRARVRTLLQTLNRARYEPPDERKKKKLIVGAK